MNKTADRAIAVAEELIEVLDRLYREREAGKHPTPAQKARLDNLLMNADSHPALADSF